MKRPFSSATSPLPLVAAGAGLIAATYGLVRLAFGLFLPDVQDDLSMDVAVAGLISGGASVVYCVGAVLGFFAAAHHARALVVASALSAAIGAAGMAAAPDVSSFAVFAIAGSAGAGLASPTLVAVLQRNPSTRERPRAQAVVNAGTGPGLVVAGLLALLLLPDWRLAWSITAVLTVVVAGAVILADRAGPGGWSARQSLPPASWFGAHARILGAALLMGCGSAAVWSFGRTFLVGSGASQAVSVTAWISLGAGATAVVVTARWMEQRGPRASWIVAVGTVAAASAALAAAPRSTSLALAACAAFGWGYTAASGALIAWTAQLDAPRAPAGTALLFITLILGQALGAGALGALISVAGYPAAFLAAALAAAAALAVPRRRRVAGWSTQVGSNLSREVGSSPGRRAARGSRSP